MLLDGTPLLGNRTGIGRYTAALAEELASMSDVDMRAVAFTLRGWRKLRKVLPHGVARAGHAGVRAAAAPLLAARAVPAGRAVRRVHRCRARHQLRAAAGVARGRAC